VLPGIEKMEKMKGMDIMSMAPKAETIAKFARKDGDTGSPEVQIALLTARIVHLTEHLKRNRKDYSTQTGLLALVNRRKKLLAYLARENYERYVSLCAELNIRRK
jgi:small subunit ribosomal protein S15